MGSEAGTGSASPGWLSEGGFLFSVAPPPSLTDLLFLAGPLGLRLHPNFFSRPGTLPAGLPPLVARRKAVFQPHASLPYPAKSRNTLVSPSGRNSGDPLPDGSFENFTN